MIYFKNLGKQGAFGNQLFQYAAAYEQSKRLKTEVCCFPNKTGYSGRCSMMNHFILDYINVPLIFNENLKYEHEWVQPDLKYHNSIYSIENETNLSGYFQSENYFINCKDDIINFYNQSEFRKKAESYFYNIGISPDDCTGIQVRRNDYIRKQSYHPVCSMEYYLKSMNICSNKYYLIISDDKPWCKDHFKNDNNIIVDSDNDIIDFYILSLCKNQIIANSSFGWWASYLNTKNNKKITYPKTWFGVNYGNSHLADLIPNSENWIGIDN